MIAILFPLPSRENFQWQQDDTSKQIIWSLDLANDFNCSNDSVFKVCGPDHHEIFFLSAKFDRMYGLSHLPRNDPKMFFMLKPPIHPLPLSSPPSRLPQKSRKPWQKRLCRDIRLVLQKERSWSLATMLRYHHIAVWHMITHGRLRWSSCRLGPRKYMILSRLWWP